MKLSNNGLIRLHYTMIYMKQLFAYLCLLLPIAVYSQTLPSVGNSAADAHIVRLAQQGYRIEGASLSYDGKTLWLSLRKSPREVHDLYTCDFNGVRWQQPVLQQQFSTENNEWEPTISSDGQTLYFIRQEMRHSSGKKEFLATNLYTSSRRPDGSWQQPQQMPISNGHDRLPVILKDNITLCFTSTGRDADKKGEIRYFIRKIDKYNWTLPQPLPADIQNENNLCRPIMAISGTVTDVISGKPVSAHIDVYDALTLRRLAYYNINNDGVFNLILTAGRKYRLDAWQNDYSHEYITLDATSLQSDTLAQWQPQITKQLRLNISAYDADNMSKLDPSIELRDTDSDIRLINAAKKQANGTWSLTLNIGKKYSLHFSQAAYADTLLYIDTRRDVRFADTDIDIQMHAGKIPVRLMVTDATNGEPLDADVLLFNRTQEEDPVETNVPEQGRMLTLKCATQYSIQLNKEKYLYKDTLISLPSFEQSEPYPVLVALAPLQKETVVQLRNIEFEFNSYLLKGESYIELHQVAELLRQNPTLHIEISAHTDDIGSDAYNLRLSKKRGEATAEYLIKQEGVNPAQLKTVGYGKNKPLVPNTSDENRAINRRVEFTILDL